jgi:TatD DNase family protein
LADFLNISTRQSEWDESSARPSATRRLGHVGVHPHEADAHPDLGAARCRGADHPRVIAIGECGLDYYYDKSDRAAQRERFQAHIEAHGRPACRWWSIPAMRRTTPPRF